MAVCCCSSAGTAACKYCSNNPNADLTPTICTVQTDTTVPDYPLFKMRDEKPQTNADRIRAMSDEELAKFVAGTDFCELLCNDTPVCIDGQCFARLFDWLRQEAKDA